MWVPPRFIPDEEVVLGELEFSGVGPPISEEEKRRAREQYDGEEPADIGPISEEAREKANDLLPPADGDREPASLGPAISEEERRRARERAEMDGPHPDDPPKCPTCGWWLFEGGQMDYHAYYCANCRYRGDGGQNGR